jgi:hypothetical protein
MKWHPQPHVLDLRSLALFRILLGFEQLFDVYSRTSNGKYDLAWYTSSPPGHSYAAHTITTETDYELPWVFPFVFTRRSVEGEVAYFIVFTILAVFLLVGFKARWVLPIIMMMNAALQSKAAPLVDGSDCLLTQLLLCMCLLPCSQVWSVDAYLARRYNPSVQTHYKNNQVSSIACLCLTLQIVMMYLGCFFNRTFDSYTVSELIKGDVSDWMWPDFPLVHYASNGGGVFKSFVSDIIRTTPLLNQFMTFSGFFVELVCPLICFLFNQRYSHWGAIPLFLLHFGIGQIINIPHWIQMGCFLQVIWIPTHVWEMLLGKSTDKGHDKAPDSKVKDGENALLSFSILNEISNSMALCLLYLLVTTWATSRGWISDRFGHSDLADSYGFFNSDWNMWSHAPRRCPFTMILGWRPSKEGDPKDRETWESINLYRFIKTGKEVLFDDFTDDLLEGFTHEYPSTRWEKGIGDEWQTFGKALVKPMGRALCNMINEDLQKQGAREISFVQFAVHSRRINPPGTRPRWQKASDDDTRTWQVNCKSINTNIDDKVEDEDVDTDEDDDEEEEDGDDEEDDDDE